MKKAHRFLNCVMGSFSGVFIGRAAAVVWNVLMHPERHAAQSAPWYTEIVMHGVWTIAALAICMVLKGILKRFMAQ